LVDEFNVTPVAVELLNEQHLMHIFPGKPVWGCDDDAVNAGRSHQVAQPIQPGSP
jgi:hypothetical protein